MARTSSAVRRPGAGALAVQARAGVSQMAAVPKGSCSDRRSSMAQQLEAPRTAGSWGSRSSVAVARYLPGDAWSSASIPHRQPGGALRRASRPRGGGRVRRTECASCASSLTSHPPGPVPAPGAGGVIRLRYMDAESTPCVPGDGPPRVCLRGGAGSVRGMAGRNRCRAGGRTVTGRNSRLPGSHFQGSLADAGQFDRPAHHYLVTALGGWVYDAARPAG